MQLRRGAGDLPAFRAAVDRIAGPGDFAFSTAAAERAKVQRSIDLQARALRLAGGFGALVALILLAQALMRQAEHAAADHPTLRAIGMSRRQLTAVGIARAGVVAAGTAMRGGGDRDRAVAADADRPCPRPRAGARRRVDARRSRSALSAIFAAVLAAGTIAAALRAGPPRRAGSDAPALARVSLPPALLAGLRPAAAARPTIAGATGAVAVVAAALTFSASLDRLLTTPRLYGQNWDYEAPFDPSVVPALRAGEGIPGLPPDRALGAAAVGTGSRLAREREARRRERVRRRQGPRAADGREGRAPRAPDEILLARRTLDALDVRIGDSVEVRQGRARRPDARRGPRGRARERMGEVRRGSGAHVRGLQAGRPGRDPLPGAPARRRRTPNAGPALRASSGRSTGRGRAGPAASATSAASRACPRWRPPWWRSPPQARSPMRS